MPEQSNDNQKLSESQVIDENPYKNLINELYQLQNVIQNELQTLRKKHASLKSELQSLIINQAHQKGSQDNNNRQENGKLKNINNSQSLSKSLEQITQSINLKSKDLKKIQLRLQLLSLSSNLGFLSHSRLDQLETIFNHYCQYIFKSGRHVTFDRIQYEKQHLIMQRFFAFIHDFHLNKFHDPLKPAKQLIPKHQLILIFKKSASNSRNLQFPQFITSLERFALLRYHYQDTYDERKQKEQKQRRRIKQINLRRQKQRERKRKQKQDEQQKQKQQQKRKAAQQQEKNRKQELASNNLNNQSQELKQQTKQERKQRKKRQKQKKKKKKPQNQQQNNQNQHQNENQLQQQSQNVQNVQQNENNDHILNQLMKKNNQIQNPNEQFNRLEKYKKSDKSKNLKNTEQKVQLNKNQLLSLTRQEKIELLFRLIQLDDPKAVELKLRQYEKPLFKQLANERKSVLQDSNSVSKLKQTQYKNQLRLGELKQKLALRKKQQFKLNVSRSITDEKYNQKKKDDFEKYLNKSLAGSNHDMNSLLMKKNQLRNKSEEQTISLNMINQSSQKQLQKLKLNLNLKRFIQSQDQDSIFLKEYGQINKIRSSNSSYISKNPRYSLDLKERANKMEEEQKKQEQQKLQRFALQMYKNQHYMKRFLQRRL